MRQLNQNGVELLKQFEGWSASAYKDIAGIWTIGYGSIFGLDGKRVTSSHREITIAEGEALLRRDVKIACDAVDQFITSPLTDNQYAALVSFTYNTGAGALQRSTLRRVINRGELDEVPAQWMRWVWAGGKKSNGLKNRRSAELELFLRNGENYTLDAIDSDQSPKKSSGFWVALRRNLGLLS